MKREFNLFDDYGNLIKQSSSYVEELKEGWIVMYKEPLQRLVMECKEYSKVRVFVYLTTLQTYDSLVFTTISSIAKKLDITYKTAWTSIQWLEANNYIKKTERDGIPGFLLNPKITTLGKKSLKVKNALWSMDFSDFQTIDKETGEIYDNNVEIEQSKSQ